MKIRICLALAAALLLSPIVPTFADERAGGESAEKKIAAAKSGPIVAVKLVLAVHIEMAGQGGQDQEENVVTRGVVVDASGLVMISTRGFSAATFRPLDRIRSLPREHCGRRVFDDPGGRSVSSQEKDLRSPNSRLHSPCSSPRRYLKVEDTFEARKNAPKNSLHH